jgi:flagellar biosynthesis component FlhA
MGAHAASGAGAGAARVGAGAGASGGAGARPLSPRSRERLREAQARVKELEDVNENVLKERAFYRSKVEEVEALCAAEPTGANAGALLERVRQALAATHLANSE